MAERNPSDDQAAFGVFPQLKRNRAKQDREAAKNVPVDLARGALAGVLGAPGDIESLVRMLPYLDEKTVLPTSEDIEKRLPFRSEAPVSKGASGLGILGGGFYTGRGSPLRMIGALPSAIKHGAEEFAKASVAGVPRVIKPKGGNWFGDSVEKALDPLLTKGMINNREIPYGPDFDVAIRKRIEDLQQQASQPDYKGGAGKVAEHLTRELENPRANEAALNKWIQSNLTNYVKKEMATPEDPIRKLAEQGITHFPVAEDPTYWARKGESARQDLSGTQMAQSDLAKQWENRTDPMFSRDTAQQHQDMMHLAPGMYSDKDEWIKKLAPETNLFSAKQNTFNRHDLGFDHIMDVLRQDIAAGRIRPDQLNKVSMEQAVRRTYEYDQEMARKMRETALKQQEGFPLHKEYPEGYRWIELTNPKAVPEGYTLPEGMKLDTIDHPRYGILHTVSDPKGITQIEATDSPESALLRFYNRKGGEGYKALEDALTYEGNTMGHCVGGYCPDVAAGQSRIFSLRDAKGEPHVTVEVRPKSSENYSLPVESWFESQPQEVKNAINEAGYKGYNVRYSPQYKEALSALPPDIIQIKGKQNAKPKDDYLPYVQDFVRGGKWGDIGDLKNTGLIDINKSAIPWPEGTQAEQIDRLLGGMQDGTKTPLYKSNQEFFKKAQDELGSRYISEQEYKDWLAKQVNPDVPPAEGMKRGGVAISHNPDAMMLEVNNAHMAGGGLAKLLRAAPKSAEEIKAIAERMAPQLLGEFVRGDKGTQSVAGKTQKQFAKEKEMKHDIRPTGAERPVPKPVNIEELKDQVMVGIPGDPTISGQTLHSLNDIPLESPSPQHGGPLYGLGRDDAFWASGLGAANRVQNLAREAGMQYDAPVLGKYIMMGPESINYAQHFADANLSAINPAKMTRGQIESFNNLVREGYPYKKSGESYQRVFPAFPGIENPAEAYLHFSIDPELRKHFNALMQMPTVTEKHGLPSGIDVRHAITEPDLRDLETGVTGKSIGRLRPEVMDLGLSSHPTYSHDIPGEFLGSSNYPIPYELSFPDTVKAIRENPKQAPHEFGSLKMVGPRQIIDQQLIDEIKQYEEQIKRLTGKKQGGAVKKAQGGEINADDLIIEERPL